MIPQQLHLREAWAKSTDTSLRFFVHLLFVIEGVMGVVLIFGFKYGFDKNILLLIIYAIIGLGALTLILVFILVAFFPKNLVFDKHAHLFEKAMSYGDDSRVLKYLELMQIENTVAPNALTDSSNTQEKKGK